MSCYSYKKSPSFDIKHVERCIFQQFYKKFCFAERENKQNTVWILRCQQNFQNELIITSMQIKTQYRNERIQN